MLLNKNIKLLINYVVGPVLFIWVAWSLYRQLNAQADLASSWQQIMQAASGKQSWKLIAVVWMTFLNWGIEARKWQLLIKRLESLSLFRSMQAIFAGVALSITTPNRIGEYGGRFLFLQEGNRLRSVSLTLVGSMAQLIITFMMGAWGLVCFRSFFRDKFQGHFSILFIDATLYATLLMAILGLLFFFRVSAITQWFEKVPALAKARTYIEVLGSFKASHLFNILCLSFLRYLVFTLQYIWLLQVLGVEVSLLPGFILVSVLFLLLALYPSFALLELILRQQFSVMIIGLASANTLGIVAASTGIWLINLVVPAMIGSLLIIKVRLFANKNV
jgi:hypothetical protein